MDQFEDPCGYFPAPTPEICAFDERDREKCPELKLDLTTSIRKLTTDNLHAFQSSSHSFAPFSNTVHNQAQSYDSKPTKMTRAQHTISIALLASSLYLALYLQLIPLPALVQTEIVPVLPFWALVTFGAYLLFVLGYNVMTFNDVPEAHKELMAEIELAKTDLRGLGVEVD
ncbi:dolichol-phosphate mannosyltransferase subunit 3-domain-containing protein [Pseudomassariella vexata]|uniref:Dolichol-phosphate mannosyltransferase subunit 3 n=1 Tax=Pseudomassariella vexata TaxID=1141098 RepID=A0A1Y2DR17_9PEZI|nr:dolichol-phosphate mannosyltransferase subunit 3-domain-containing protein [Pseudomassariella vexata]ORY61743.1 dolichol-phosphate mannosyltransferase subunit 3-domain-containing protein [Pseudomassariella vexata]